MPNSKRHLAKQNAESKKRSTMHETSVAEEQQNRAESILEHQTEFVVDFHIEEEGLQFKRKGRRESQLHGEKHLRREKLRTSSYEDKVEMQDITRKYKGVNYADKTTWSGTQISSRRWSSST